MKNSWLSLGLILGLFAFFLTFYIEDIIRINRLYGIGGLSFIFLCIFMSFYFLLKYSKKSKNYIVLIILGMIPLTALLYNGLIFVVWYLPK